MNKTEAEKLKPIIDFYNERWNIPVFADQENERSKDRLEKAGKVLLNTKYSHFPMEMIKFAEAYHAHQSTSPPLSCEIEKCVEGYYTGPVHAQRNEIYSDDSMQQYLDKEKQIQEYQNGFVDGIKYERTQSPQTTTNAEIEHKLMQQFGFIEDGIDAKGQGKVFKFMEWLKPKTAESELEELFKEHQEFAKEAFPGSTWVSSLRGLEREIREVEEASTESKGDWVMEYVDCIMYLLDSMNRANINMDEFKQSFYRKMVINDARKWEQNKDGSYSHVKSPLTP